MYNNNTESARILIGNRWPTQIMPFDEGLIKVIFTKVKVGNSEPSRGNMVFRAIKSRPILLLCLGLIEQGEGQLPEP